MAEKAKELQDRITATAGRVLVELNWPGNGLNISSVAFRKSMSFSLRRRWPVNIGLCSHELWSRMHDWICFPWFVQFGRDDCFFLVSRTLALGVFALHTGSMSILLHPCVVLLALLLIYDREKASRQERGRVHVLFFHNPIATLKNTSN